MKVNFTITKRRMKSKKRFLFSLRLSITPAYFSSCCYIFTGVIFPLSSVYLVKFSFSYVTFCLLLLLLNSTQPRSNVSFIRPLYILIHHFILHLFNYFAFLSCFFISNLSPILLHFFLSFSSTYLCCISFSS